MGYENIKQRFKFNVGCHLMAPDQKLHVLMDINPFMLDDKTPKTKYALALKGLEALGEKAVLLNK